ncbi:DUF29 family protein [Halochromatium sp.]
MDQVDLEQVAEETEDMGKNDRRALESHLKKQFAVNGPASLG